MRISEDHLFIDPARVADGATFRADICIVGAGAAGLALAVSLARKNGSIICIESGDFDPREDIQALNHVEMSGLDHPSSMQGRFRIFGGTTTKWGGQMLPLDRVDFDDKPWQQLPSWPLNYDRLIPYYEEALKLTGLANVLRSDDEVWGALRLPKPTLEPHVEVFLSRWLPEPKFNVWFGPEVRSRENLSVLRAFSAVGFQGNNNHIKTLQCASLDGRRVTIEAQEFVLCMGGIETARFLLSDYADGAKTPWAENRMIGKCFADHPALRVGRFIPTSLKRFHQMFDNIYLKGLKYEPRMRLNPRLLLSQQSANIGGMFLFESRHRDTISAFVSFIKSVIAGRPTWQGMRAALGAWAALPEILQKAWHYNVHNRTSYPKDTAIYLSVSVEQPPNKESSIILSDKRDALGQKTAVMDWRIGAPEVEAMQLFISEFSAAMEDAKLGKLELEPHVAQRNSEEMIRRMCDQNHHIGATRMATEMQQGVVDQNLKVFGADNVYVCSSSVFPTGGFSNPTHTILALAIRLADHLSEKTLK